MNREFLKEQGLTDEQIEAVMKEHGKSINDIKKKADRVDGLESQIEDLTGQIQERDGQLEELKKVDAEGLQAKIDELQQANETTATEYEEKLSKQAKDFAIESALRDAQAKNPKAVKALLDMENIKLDGETLLGLDDQLTAIKESDPYLFGAVSTGGNDPQIFAPGNPNGGGNEKNPFLKEHWNLTEQGKLFKENPELYKQYKSQAGK